MKMKHSLPAILAVSFLTAQTQAQASTTFIDDNIIRNESFGDGAGPGRAKGFDNGELTLTPFSDIDDGEAELELSSNGNTISISRSSPNQSSSIDQNEFLSMTVAECFAISAIDFASVRANGNNLFTISGFTEDPEAFSVETNGGSDGPYSRLDEGLATFDYADGVLSFSILDIEAAIVFGNLAATEATELILNGRYLDDLGNPAPTGYRLHGIQYTEFKAIPEPTSTLLLGLGGLSLVLRRRR